MFKSLRQAALLCLEESDPDRKIEATRRALAAWRESRLPLDEVGERAGDSPATTTVVPGLPPGLVLTTPTKVRRRGFASQGGRAAFVHAIAHIEWNAINLAWDAVWRFDAMPHEYYDDWAGVAAEEA